VTAVWFNVCQKIEADRVLAVGGVENHQVVGPAWRDVRQDALHQVAVRVDDADAPTSQDVLEDQVVQQRGFAGAVLAENIEVLAAALLAQAKGDIGVEGPHAHV